ncbi:TetR family transcriptional regulator [Glycomyces harbinensis]|nr:TetR family transcriptional regulator [Glycomyces harbinensis]
MGDTFARARSAEQRAARRAAILATARQMLAGGGRIADLSLNELARQVGLAKSNVLRYFESREAVLLELLSVECGAWLDDFEAALAAADAPAGVERFADAFARTLETRPVLTELMANAGTVLERNVSTDAVAEYKRRSFSQIARLAAILDGEVGVLPEPGRTACVASMHIIVGGAWSATRPYPAVAAVYERHPELAYARVDFRVVVRELVAVTITGMRTRPISLEP